MPAWVGPLQAVQMAFTALLGLGYAWVAIRGRFPLLRLFCAANAFKAAILVSLGASGPAEKLALAAMGRYTITAFSDLFIQRPVDYTATEVYRDAEVLILALAALGVLEAWWLLWPPLRLPFLGWQVAIAGALASLTGWLPGESDPALAFSRLRRQFWISIGLFILVASIDAWRRNVRLNRLWGFWAVYAAAHFLSRLLSYPSYETLAHRWEGYFAAAFVYDLVAGSAILILVYRNESSQPAKEKRSEPIAA